LWAQILRECPNSRLMLKSGVLADAAIVALTRQRFTDAGGDADCLILRGPTELSLMMQEYLEVDIALDPFPYNGGTTSLQALWMGCPLVAMQGKNFVSRMGESFLTHLARKQWLAADAQDYVRIAVSLARQLREAPFSRHAQRQAMQASSLCQIEQHTREMEKIYQQAFDKQLTSL
jgi:protein O-GlcNAc transferase